VIVALAMIVGSFVKPQVQVATDPGSLKPAEGVQA